MLELVAKRAVMMLITFIGITLLTFIFLRLVPGDAAALKAGGTEISFNSGAVVKAKELYGLNRPVILEYVKWLGRTARLDFGDSFVDHRPVRDKILEALPITLLINFLALIVIYVLAIPLGLFSAIERGGAFDKITSVTLYLLYSLPIFWVGTMLIVIFGGGDHLSWFPIAGIVSDGVEVLPWYGRTMNVLWHLVLPVLCLSYGGLAFMTRFSRSAMCDVVSKDYLQAARAKGVSEPMVIFKHAGRNILIPMITLTGLIIPSLLSGSVIVEQIFSIPGMGNLSFQAVLTRDYPLVMAIVSMGAIVTMLSYFVTDILYYAVDPRMRGDK